MRFKQILYILNLIISCSSGRTLLTRPPFLSYLSRKLCFRRTLRGSQYARVPLEVDRLTYRRRAAERRCRRLRERVRTARRA